MPNLIRDASPLTGVDMIEADKTGVVVWKVRVGQLVKIGDILGEIVDIFDVEVPRVKVVSKIDGIVFAMKRHKFVRGGQVIIKVAGSSPLSWRQGDLLTV